MVSLSTKFSRNKLFRNWYGKIPLNCILFVISEEFPTAHYDTNSTDRDNMIKTCDA